MDYILDTLAKVGFDWKMGLFQFINFLVVFWILKRFAFKPIMAVVDERQKKEKTSIENFQKAKTELQMAEQKAQGIIDEAKVDANKRIEASHNAAKEQGEQLKAKAKAEIDALIVQAKKNIAIDKKEMQESLRKETVELVVRAVEKVIGDKIDGASDTAYIKEILASLK
ncbi:F0F1 ATP synthase subunit B [Patescibacteria group bacterium]|nr:F0F1 ATP synthase subunit B [Patescibacteria group bacterium]MBU1722006.1 F0F1 ATP synthase subunit B [Patescibacteria group bacterium]MBU1901244.1 F0F1 ATP synthase subunit B [Patescibacteria group bacterium]